LYTFLIASLILIGYTLRYVYDDRTSYYIVVRIYNIVEYSILAYLFSLHIRNKIVKVILLSSIGIFLLFCFFDFVNEKIPGLPFVPLSVEYIVLLIFIIYYFFEIMQEMVNEPIYQKAIFWISVAFIINFSGNFFLFLSSMNSFNDEAFRRQYIIIYATVTVTKNILLSISILIKEQQESLPTSNPIDIDLDTFHSLKDKT
jgi:hypothetical protein